MGNLRKEYGIKATQEEMTKIIAEIGLAHMGSKAKAVRLINSAVSAGCDYAKFQVYKTDELIDKHGDLERYKRFKERELSYDTFLELKEYCDSVGIKFLATPHTIGAFSFLDTFCDEFKIGSGDRGEILELAIQSGKHYYVSTGLRSERDIRDLIWKCSGSEATILHCITQYPVTDESANLGYMRTLAHRVPRWGYSDHYPGTYACELAVAMGAQVIEKHIRLPESEGQDNSCALDQFWLKELVRKIRKIEKMIGSSERIYNEEERSNEQWAIKGSNGKRPLNPYSYLELTDISDGR